MGRKRGWGAEQTGRAPMPSPGRPGLNQRATKQAFWRRIAAGLSSEEAALASGVSTPVGGMPPINLVPPSGRYLSLAEREELALLKAQQYGIRAIARRLGRSPSTISRELRRNAVPHSRTLQYRATVAQWKTEHAVNRPKIAKLVDYERLCAYVQNRLAGVVTDVEGRPIPGPQCAL